MHGKLIIILHIDKLTYFASIIHCHHSRVFLHDYLLQKIRAQNPQKVFLKDVTLGRTETFGHFAESVVKVASGLTKVCGPAITQI